MVATPRAKRVSSPSRGSATRTPSQGGADVTGRRSGSPLSYAAVDDIATLPVAMQRRIGHLMKTLSGKMGGAIELRRDAQSPWTSCYCYINHNAGRLMFESGTAGPHQTLISNLFGATTQYSVENEELLIEVRSADQTEEVHVKPATQQEFDAWYAALAHWQSLDVTPQPTSATNTRSRAGSNRSDRRRSLAATVPKENPVIKIGKMIYWETSVGFGNSSTTSLGHGSSGRSGNYMMQAASTRRWRRVSGQLRENGELKLHADGGDSLISLVQLSQLSRCAIQRLDSSVLETDHCIAIYPQYTSSYTSGPSNLNRPILLSLESRVLYEVWFVLLRAFTMPSIYGPRLEGPQGLDSSGLDMNRDLENMIATSTSYAFRMERSLNIRIIEAKMASPTVGVDSLVASGVGKNQAYNNADKHGYYAEVLLDGETRGKTVVKYDTIHPLWLENFEFQDLPPVLGSASVTLRRRPPEPVLARERDVRQMPETYTESQGVVASLGFDVLCGKVEIHLDELEGDHTVDRWWPAFNAQGQKVGDVLINARPQEGIVLMARDYRPLAEILHRFENSLTIHMADLIPSETKRLCDCLLDIFQASGKATDWIMSLIEEEIDGINKETPITRLRYVKRAGSDAANEAPIGSYSGASEREAIVRDLNKTATLEANLLFRGNTLLTRALDTHMRRIGKEWLDASLTETLFDIVIKDLDCEVDPSRVSPSEVSTNWGRLLLATQDVWRAIMSASSRCPVELRLIFRHIRHCAEDRYGDHLRTVQYSSISGFLFLRFFVPAVLNPNLFGLMKGDLKPRTRRTLTLIAKSLQTMANMATFGAKEPWMEPMNAFIVQHRDGFKRFVDEVCHLPESATSHPSSPTSPPIYNTPTTIMQRLPPSSREGFPSLPYLVDQARSYAELIQLWLESVEALSRPTELIAIPTRSHADILNAIAASDESFVTFNELCESLSARTQECLARAERAERPESAPSYNFEEVIEQLHR
ncbi:Rho GTPase activation protein, partial [Dissoconium aciculare CBS 342.82]|uniref:Rho GTPase activation protein n=1 Tax=Dissoconium aciculare CBS 342.82 TaxID=1314786 RepID=A0A6J3MBK2_9PEZI